MAHQPQALTLGAAAGLSRGLLTTACAVLLGAAALAVPSFVEDVYVLDVLTRVALFGILALGLNVVVARAGLLDLGYIAFWGIGAYTTALLASPRFGLHLSLLATTVASMAAAAVFAVVIGFPTLRVRGDYLAIVTLGFGEIIRIALNNLDRLTGGPSGIQAIDVPTIAGHDFGYEPSDYFRAAVVGLVLAAVVATWLGRGRIGLIWSALRDDEIAARASGLRPVRAYLAAFAIGATFAGLSGSLFARVQAAVSPDSFTVDQSILVLTIVVLAGLSGRLLPVLLAAAVMIAIPELLRATDQYRMVVFGPLLVLSVIVRENATSISRRLRSRRSRAAGGETDG